MAVVVLDPDPSMAGQAARVARWDFASEATAAFYRKTAAAEGIFLELTWPGDPPKHRALEVFVRYTTDDGRKLEARRPIRLDLANQPRGRAPCRVVAPGLAGPGGNDRLPDRRVSLGHGERKPGRLRRLATATIEQGLAGRRRIRGEAQARAARLVARPALSEQDTTASRQP